MTFGRFLAIADITKNGYSTHFCASLSPRIQCERTPIHLNRMTCTNNLGIQVHLHNTEPVLSTKVIVSRSNKAKCHLFHNFYPVWLHFIAYCKKGQRRPQSKLECYIWPKGFPLDLENLEKSEYIWKTWKYYGILKKINKYHGKMT